ncbi:hypothetical protein [Pontibacter kalidii]|uniref:hypothetical protein n=1 Tax=Pontibacter kalidii TaxID=2592049 RepID=UPI0022511EF4|nr:hypothetical protein [Pontibacter kalidii]
MKERIGLTDFLTLVEEEAFDKFEILDYIEEVTNNHQPHRLKALLDEVDIHICIRRDELEFEYRDKINAALHQCSLQGKEPPYQVLSLPGNEPKEIVHKDRLLNGAISMKLYPLYELKRDIISISKASMFKATLEQGQTLQELRPQQKLSQPDLASASNREFGFYYHLTEDGKKVYPIVKELYSTVKQKKEYAIMLVVLNELGYLMNKHFTNKEQLTNALKTTFGKIIGSRQNLFTYVERYSDAPGPAELEELKRHKQRLLDAINKASQQSFANNT